MTKPAYDLPALADLPVAGPFPGGAAPSTAPAAPVEPAVRPTNVARSLFHMASGVVALASLRLLPDRAWLVAVSGAIAAAGWSMEAARRRSPAVNVHVMRVFAPVAHPHERHRINSSTWYVTALLALALFAPVRAAEVGVLVLALADPAAGVVGRRFGRTRLSAGRSVEGSLAFLVIGALAAFGWLSVVHALPRHEAVAVAAAAAVAGALAELVSTRLDDNLTIPVASAAAAAAAGLVFPLL